MKYDNLNSVLFLIPSSCSMTTAADFRNFASASRSTSSADLVCVPPQKKNIMIMQFNVLIKPLLNSDFIIYIPS